MKRVGRDKSTCSADEISSATVRTEHPEMATEPLPQEGESAEIGHRAVRAFNAQAPANWRFQDLSGDSDAGIDGFIQVVIDGRYSEAFHAQFKGSTIPANSADQTFVSVRLRVATINYYRRVGGPIMLVFADLSDDGKPATCPIYYLWIHEKLDEALVGVSNSTSKDATVSFRVPRANRLDDQLDVAPHLAAQRDLRRRFENLTQAIRGVPDAPAAPSALGQLANNIALRGATFLESTLSSADTPWPDPTPGTIAWDLKQLHDRILDGAVDDAKDLVGRIDARPLRDAQEQAEFAFLKGCLARLSGDAELTAAGLAEAHERAPTNSRYFTAWVEERLVRKLPSHEVARALLEEINKSGLHSDPKVRSMRARALTILERFDEAHAELDQLPPRHAAIERVLTFLSQRRLDEAIISAHGSRELDVSRQTLLTLRILSARAHFEQVFALRPGQESPPTGPPELDATQLVSLWNELRTLGQDLANAGWPLNSEFLLDVLTAVSVAARRADEGLVLLDAFLHSRPFRQELQINRLKLAIFAGNFPIALDAARHLPNERDRTIHLVLVHYQAEQFQQAVALIPDLLSLELETEEYFPEALVVAAHSARRTFNSSAEQQCLAKLKDDGYSDQVAVLNLVSAAGTDRETRDAARKSFIEAYRSNAGSEVLQNHLVSALRAREPAEANLLIEVTATIRSRRQLRLDEAVALANALTTLDRVADAIHILHEAQLRFPNDPQLIASEALICEKSGDIPRARKLLTSLLDSNSSSELARSVYIVIATRSGLLDEAVAQLESLLAAANAQEQRKQALLGLISVELFRAPQSPRLQTLVQRLGEIVDQTSEDEEGMYIQTLLISGILAATNPSEPARAELQRRITAYTERFPDSKYFGAIPLPTSGGAAAFEEALKKKFGARLEASEDLKLLRRQLSRGLAIVPYAWRPRLVVPAARTVSQLWELTKRVGRGNLLLTFDIDHQSQALKDLRRESRIPLIDLLSLLVITDLELWPVILRIFDRVAISKQVLLRIQHDDGPLSVPSETLRRLREAIRVHFDSIEQPGALDDTWLDTRDGGLEEAKTLVATGRFSFYSDDVVSRVYVLGERDGDLGLNTGQLIRNAEQVGDLSAGDVGRRIAQLIRWNIGGVSFDNRHLLECLPKELSTARDLNARIAALHKDPHYQTLVSGIWDVPKPYLETANHIARLLAFVLRYNSEIDSDVLAAICASWLDKVVLRSDIPLTVEQHLAGVLVLASFDLRESAGGPTKLWQAYIALVARHHHARMDEVVEKDAIRAVGRMIASAVGNRDEFRNRADDVIAAVRRGLTPGTADYQYVMDGYNEARSLQFSRIAAKGT